uniref:EGF-like domain-containing protein n=2 Tax=Tetraodon nigroviridis TaxID=99883 RepID=H3C7I7_TETNG
VRALRPHARLSPWLLSATLAVQLRLGWGGRFCDKDLSVCVEKQPCRHGATCVMEDGRRRLCGGLTCRCLAGFTGRRCEADVDDCLMAPCANGATCLDGVNRFSCVCPPGFSGRFCTVNLERCVSRPCSNGGRCIDRAGGFRCICQTRLHRNHLPDFAEGHAGAVQNSRDR